MAKKKKTVKKPKKTKKKKLADINESLNCLMELHKLQAVILEKMRRDLAE